MRFGLFGLAMLAACVTLQPIAGLAQEAAPAPAGAQQVLAQSAAAGKFTYIVFYREDDQATRTMAQVVGDSVAKQPAAAASAFVQITNPAEQAIVTQFAVSRAPMPLTIVTAPNGAITGVFPQRVVEKQLAEAYVTPAMSHCMKAMQQGKLVFLCLQTTPTPTIPQGVSEFLADAQFKDRGNVVMIQNGDPAEAQLLAELQLGSGAGQANTVFFAPPGVLVGKFSDASTMHEIAGALHKAGKCCDDPNCKHGHAHGPKASSAR